MASQVLPTPPLPDAIAMIGAGWTRATGACLGVREADMMNKDFALVFLKGR
jgi:hypothetical protein